MRPGYKPPTRNALATELLDTVSLEVNNNFIAKYSESNRPLTLITDGWSNVKNNPIMAVSIQSGVTSFLLNISECGAERKTAEYCFQIVKGSIENIQTEFSGDIFAVLTNNENKMRSLRTKIENYNPKILTYGCNSH